MTGQGLELLFDSFCDVADRLDMPEAERAGILAVPPQDWPLWRLEDENSQRCDEIRRRLEYALPLMRLSLANRTAKLQ